MASNHEPAFRSSLSCCRPLGWRLPGHAEPGGADHSLRLGQALEAVRHDALGHCLQQLGMDLSGDFWPDLGEPNGCSWQQIREGGKHHGVSHVLDPLDRESQVCCVAAGSAREQHHEQAHSHADGHLQEALLRAHLDGLLWGKLDEANKALVLTSVGG